MVLLLMTIVLSANALMWSMVTKTRKKGLISAIFRMLMMVLTMFIMILTMMKMSTMVMMRNSTLKWSIVTKSGKKGRISSILTEGHSFKNSIASLMSFFSWTTCLAT